MYNIPNSIPLTIIVVTLHLMLLTIPCGAGITIGKLDDHTSGAGARNEEIPQ